MLSFDEDSDSETDLLMAATGMVNEHFLIPPRRGGSSKKREANVDHDQEAGNERLYKDYFDPINPLYKEQHFIAGIGCRETCSCTRTTSRLSTIAPVKLASPLTKNVSRPFDSLHMECQMISLTIISA
jgi:hypothetical protein